jgi:hypothetical protein
LWAPHFAGKAYRLRSAPPRTPPVGVVVLQDIEKRLFVLSPRKTPRSQQRICYECGARLSRYNPSPNQCALHTPRYHPLREGGRADEGAGLENRQALVAPRSSLRPCSPHDPPGWDDCVVGGLATARFQASPWRSVRMLADPLLDGGTRPNTARGQGYLRLREIRVFSSELDRTLPGHAKHSPNLRDSDEMASHSARLLEVIDRGKG